ncbi:MAG: DUF2948 family protein [Pseudomonadota bacterium]
MVGDARFEDAPLASDRPLRLRAETADDLSVLSTLLQDAVGRAGDLKWLPKKRRLVVLVNRFRWEDHEDAERMRRPFERVRSALSVENVLRVRARGIEPGDPEVIVSILSISFETGEDGSGTLALNLAGDGEITAQVECLDASLADLTKPWTAQAAQAPAHNPPD